MAESLEREFEFSQRDFERVRGLLRAHAGIALHAGKQNMVYSRLARRLRALGMTSVSQYLNVVEAAGPAVRQDFINALTTNLTAFWREAHHFPVLAEHLRARAAAGAARLDLWCCAAASGEEAYTIAITAMQAFDSMAPPVRILASDIDTRVLEVARRGSYPAEAVAALAEDTRRRYFQPGERVGEVRVRPQVAALVAFRHINLMEPMWPLRGGFTAVFCRNVMIYFDRPTQLALVRRIARLVEPGGLLFAGHSESFADAKDVLRLKGRTVYERLPGDPSAPVARRASGSDPW